jgi:hypothetical protein
MRVKILKYTEWAGYFTCFTEDSTIGDSDGEFKMDPWELGMAFFPDENHTVTQEDYKSLVGREFDIERHNIRIYLRRIFDKDCAKIVEPGKERWTFNDKEPCGRCGELCECGEYITREAYKAEQEMERLRRQVEMEEYEARMAPIREQERIDKAYNEFLNKQLNKKAMA